jgi:hypothetical protein
MANKVIQKFINIKTSPSESKELLTNYLDLLIDSSEIEDIFLIDKKNEDLKDLAEEVIRLLSSYSNIINLIKPNTIIENEVKFYDSLNDSISENSAGSKESDYHKLIEKYIKEGNLLDEIKNHEFKKELSSLYLSSIKIEKGDEGFIEYLKNGLNSMSEENLEKEITNDYDNTINLIIEMVKNSISPKLKTPFMDLLISKVDMILDNKTVEELISKNWNYLINALDENHKRILLEKIRYKLNNDNRDFSKVFELFGDELLKSEIFEAEIDDVVNEGFSNLIDRKNPSELKWLEDLIERNRAMFKKCPESNLSVFKEKIKHWVKESKEDENLNNHYKKLAELLGIKIKEDKKEKDTNN